MSRQNVLDIWRSGNQETLARAIADMRPTPPPPVVAPVSGRVPALGDDVEVVVHTSVLAVRTRRMDTTWVRDQVSELRYQDAAPGFTTAERGARPWLSEEGTRWRWPKDATAGAPAPLKGAP